MGEVNSAITNIVKLLQGVGLSAFLLAASYLAIQAIFRGVMGIIALMLGLGGAVLGLMVLFLAGPIAHAVQGAIGTGGL